MKVLVIGASGLLAKPVIKHFDKEGFQVKLFSRTVATKMFEKNYEIVQGDVFNTSDLEKAMEDCDAVHITIGQLDESEAVKNIVRTSLRQNITLLSYISGASVKKENMWFPMIENKWKAEQIIKESGISYVIFRPTWFMESLSLMVRDGRAVIIGKQKNPVSLVAADDLAHMTVNAYKNKTAYNKTFYIYGPEQFLLKEALEKYCNIVHPEIKKVSVIPAWVMKFIGFITGNKELKEVAAMFSYFEKVKEDGNPEEANKILGKPQITFNKWLNSLKK